MPLFMTKLFSITDLASHREFLVTCNFPTSNWAGRLKQIFSSSNLQHLTRFFKASTTLLVSQYYYLLYISTLGMMPFSMYYLKHTLMYLFITKISDPKSSLTVVVALFPQASWLTHKKESSRFITPVMSVPKPPAGHFNVLFFASASSFTGKDYDALPATMPLSKLFAELENRYPGIKAKILDSCLVTVNLDYVDLPGEEGAEDTMIREADEVAIIPPVSSG
jgi:molybdopterin converting factor small subunit